ncbi:MAG: hypothetical protein P9L92_02305 [Candidatus Electryonea clarkiae]|nr:hypothetical protein [Candidatus Electryonea clarkiae]MDP8287295.1 hypothetical protein [Candidatus Electryonea clarkiae]
MFVKTRVASLLIIALFMVNGCSEDDNPSGPTREKLKNYFPLESGSSWTYDIIFDATGDTIGTFTEGVYEPVHFQLGWWYELKASYDYYNDSGDAIFSYYNRLDYDTLFYRNDDDYYGVIGIIPTDSLHEGEEILYELDPDDPQFNRRIIYQETLESLDVGGSTFYDVLVESVEEWQSGVLIWRDTFYWAVDIGCVYITREFPEDQETYLYPIKEYHIE